MGWAARHIEALQKDQTVRFRPHGQSMRGRVESGQMCTVAPIDDHGQLSVGDVVLCSVKGCDYLHLIKAKRANQWLIGNNRGGINGWVGASQIFGKLIAVED